VVGGGDGAGVGFGDGFTGCVSGAAAGAGEVLTGLEASDDDRRGARWTTTRGATCRVAPALCGTVRCRGWIRTTGGAGVGVATRGVATTRCSAGELDSKAARQRYPEVTPAATSRQSRSASNEIRTRISIDLPDDSIGADLGISQRGR
jgi:hypothetical protein